MPVADSSEIAVHDNEISVGAYVALDARRAKRLRVTHPIVVKSPPTKILPSVSKAIA